MPVIVYSGGGGGGGTPPVTEDISAQIATNLLSATYYSSAPYTPGSLSVFFNGSLMAKDKDYIELDNLSFQFIGLLSSDLTRIFTADSILIIKYIPS